jgi:hypothetical protein
LLPRDAYHDRGTPIAARSLRFAAILHAAIDTNPMHDHRSTVLSGPLRLALPIVILLPLVMPLDAHAQLGPASSCERLASAAVPSTTITRVQ